MSAGDLSLLSPSPVLDAVAPSTLVADVQRDVFGALRYVETPVELRYSGVSFIRERR